MSEIQMDDKLQQLCLLKKMTETVGCLHDGQFLQLNCYPAVLESITKWEVHLDAVNRKVTYELKGRNRKSHLKEYPRIQEWIRKYVLWDETKVVFKVNGKVKKWAT